MKDVNREVHTKEKIQRLLYGVTFFKSVIDNEPTQFELLFEQSKILEVESNEIVIHKGDKDPFLYFLLKGRLVVLPHNKARDSEIINEINPGQLFGAMSMVTGQARSATVKTLDQKQPTLLFAINSNAFKDIHDFSTFTMATKISFYRLIVHNIRWTLETNKMKEPSHPLVTKMRALTLFRGEKNSMEELESLSAQSNELASILNEWNGIDK